MRAKITGVGMVYGNTETCSSCFSISMPHEQRQRRAEAQFEVFPFGFNLYENCFFFAFHSFFLHSGVRDGKAREFFKALKCQKWISKLTYLFGVCMANSYKKKKKKRNEILNFLFFILFLFGSLSAVYYTAFSIGAETLLEDIFFSFYCSLVGECLIKAFTMEFIALFSVSLSLSLTRFLPYQKFSFLFISEGYQGG
jgi:hypothetical protein